MSIDIFIAGALEGLQDPINIANVNFYHLMDDLALSEYVDGGEIPVEGLSRALWHRPKTRYTDRLLAMCAIAKAVGCPIIGFC